MKRDRRSHLELRNVEVVIVVGIESRENALVAPFSNFYGPNHLLLPSNLFLQRLRLG